MSEIEKIKRYIDKHGVSRNSRYDASFKEVLAIAKEMDPVNAVSFAFDYGRAKGYQIAKAEARL